MRCSGAILLKSTRSLLELAAGRTEAATAAIGRGKLRRGNEFHAGHGSNHQLRDTLAAPDRERHLAVVDQEHADLAAIIRVNRAGRIQHSDAVLRCEARARTDLRLIARWQRDRQSGRHQRALARRQDQRRTFGNRRQQVEPRGVRTLIRRQRRALAMRQLPDIDLYCDAQDGFSAVLAVKVLATRATSAAATSSLVIAGQDSILISTSILSPSRVSRWTVLRSPPITPDAGETSLATIQSQPLRASLALALSIRFSVSAANPITSHGRLSCNFAIVARISGFSTSCSGSMPAAVFLSFCSPSLATRQSATAAAKIAMSTGSAASTRCSISRADSTCFTVTPAGSPSSTGPEINVTSAPAACAAAAMA